MYIAGAPFPPFQYAPSTTLLHSPPMSRPGIQSKALARGRWDHEEQREVAIKVIDLEDMCAFRFHAVVAKCPLHLSLDRLPAQHCRILDELFDDSRSTGSAALPIVCHLLTC